LRPSSPPLSDALPISDAFVRVPPCLFQEGNYDLGDGFDTGMRRQMATNGLHHGIRDLSVDVELGLGGGGVADAHRLGIAIAGERSEEHTSELPSREKL